MPCDPTNDHSNKKNASMLSGSGSAGEHRPAAMGGDGNGEQKSEGEGKGDGKDPKKEQKREKTPHADTHTFKVEDMVYFSSLAKILHRWRDIREKAPTCTRIVSNRLKRTR